MLSGECIEYGASGKIYPWSSKNRSRASAVSLGFVHPLSWTIAMKSSKSYILCEQTKILNQYLTLCITYVDLNLTFSPITLYTAYSKCFNLYIFLTMEILRYKLYLLFWKNTYFYVDLYCQDIERGLLCDPVPHVASGRHLYPLACSSYLCTNA